VVKGLDPAAEGLEPLMVPNDRFRIYALKGKKTVLAWVRDPQTTWMSELRDGRQPPQVEGLHVDLGAALSGFKAAGAEVYDPWTGKWSNGRLKGSKVRLPQFRRSVVVKLAAKR